MSEYWEITSRVLIVLVSSTAGLMVGSLIHYAFFEDTQMYWASSSASRKGNYFMVAAILFFSLAVYVLYLNILPAYVVSLVGLLGAKLLWNIGDGFHYAGRLYNILARLNADAEPARRYLKRAYSYRQVQDLRTVARSMFVPGSQQLKSLESIIAETIGDHARPR